MNTKITINQVYRLFNEPAVWLTSGTGGMKALLQVAEPGATCLINLIWVFTLNAARVYLPMLKEFKKKKIRTVVLGSCWQDIVCMRALGIRCVLMNQNQFLLEENIPLRVMSGCDAYDAFYAAQAQPFKRLHLASEIKSLYVLTYNWPKGLNESRILKEFEPKLAHAHYNRSYVDFDEVSKLMSSSSCALALSWKEGAMWAAYEALLAGVPLVSTPSIGGRHRYFDSETVRIVKPTSAAVKAGVDYWLAKRPDPEHVRSVTLKKIEGDREVAVSYFKKNILLGSKEYSAEDIYQRLFRDGHARTPLSL